MTSNSVQLNAGSKLQLANLARELVIECVNIKAKSYARTASADAETCKDSKTSLGSLPQPIKKVGVIRDIPQQAEFTPHPVSLGVDYDMALAAFHFKQTTSKKRKKLKKLTPLRSLTLEVPHFPNETPQDSEQNRHKHK